MRRGGEVGGEIGCDVEEVVDISRYRCPACSSVVEGSMGADLEDERMLDWVREVGGKARYVVSLCDGAFVLAAAGLLDGHKCTTFPSDQDRFAATFPELELVRGVSFVHDGRILTSEGGALSYDVAMHLVDHIYGESVATGVGRGLIIAWPPAELAALVVE